MALVWVLAALIPSLGADQSELARRVEERLRSEARLVAYDWIEFALDGDKLTIAGYSSSPYLAPRIERLIANLPEIKEVVNLVEALPSEGPDVGVRVNAYWRLYGHPELRRYSFLDAATLVGGDDLSEFRPVLAHAIHIIVRDGRITLKGRVQYPREKQIAEEQARKVIGAESVVNELVVITGETTSSAGMWEHDELWWQDESSAYHPSLRIENPSGRTRVRVANVDKPEIRTSSPEREIRENDTLLSRVQRKVRLQCRPEDGAVIDLDIDIPYGYGLEVVTTDGATSLEGLFRRAEVITGSGEVDLTAPWNATRLSITARNRPDKLSYPAGGEFVENELSSPGKLGNWVLKQGAERSPKPFGDIVVRGNWPRSLSIEPMGTPVDSPVRMHWEAPSVLSTMFRRGQRGELIRRGAAPEAGSSPTGSLAPETAHFSADVRLIELMVSVVDEAGAPLTKLDSGDFEIIESGTHQKVSLFEGAEAPLNLVMLLDCSTSTLSERTELSQAARRLISLARPQDRVAVHVLADTYLQTLSPLTEDREKLLRTVRGIPPLSGGTPLYDAIVLSYARELAKLRGQRNAMILITDGLDNQIMPQWKRSVPSKVSFEDLRRVATEMESLIYPIVLEPYEPKLLVDREWAEKAKGWRDQARDQLNELIDASGGRMFRARSLKWQDPVYGQISEELRSVYTIGYYPDNQTFDGAWREVSVRLKNRKGTVRVRPGYYAW